MYANTYGLGPFHPMIVTDNEVWIADVTFDTEDEAHTAAQGVVTLLKARAEDYMWSLGYAKKV